MARCTGIEILFVKREYKSKFLSFCESQSRVNDDDNFRFETVRENLSKNYI